MSSPDRTAPPFPTGPLNEATKTGEIAVRVGLWQQGGMTEDDVDVDDLDEWKPASQRWEMVEA